jgi:hypothetical protein
MDFERIGRSRLKLRLTALRSLIDVQQSRAFRALCEQRPRRHGWHSLSLCECYATLVLMVDDLRKEDPVRVELLTEYETMCRAM